MKSRFIYWLVYSGMWLFSALPFRILYLLSDFNYLLMYRIGRYRRKVVRENLKKSFPEKDKKERLQIERRFYRYLSDYMLEDLKMLHMSPEDLYKRMTYKNTEQYLELTEKYGGIIVMIPHYANYEWLIGMGSIMKPGDVPMQVYKPLKDKYLNELFQRIRSRFGGMNEVFLSTGFHGMVSAFSAAGVKYVISSLWSVNDLATAVFMDAFYSYYANGAEEPPTALRKAQDYLRDATIEELRMQGWFRSDTYQLLDDESQEFMESLEEKNGRWKPFRKEAFWGGFVCCQCH